MMCAKYKGRRENGRASEAIRLLCALLVLEAPQISKWADNTAQSGCLASGLVPNNGTILPPLSNLHFAIL